MSTVLKLDSEQETLAAGERLAARLLESRPQTLVVHLFGDLGAGKTTFVRGFLRGMGHEGRVPSPTYTLIEPYELHDYAVAHIDLYRLKAPGEAATLALDELTGERSLMLVEWPDRGGAMIPAADLEISLQISGSGRELTLTTRSPAGKMLNES